MVSLEQPLEQITTLENRESGNPIYRNTIYIDDIILHTPKQNLLTPKQNLKTTQQEVSIVYSILNLH